MCLFFRGREVLLAAGYKVSVSSDGVTVVLMPEESDDGEEDEEEEEDDYSTEDAGATTDSAFVEPSTAEDTEFHSDRSKQSGLE